MNWRGAKDFSAITRGIRKDADQELLLVGRLALNGGRI
jgi:hypothetical protein